MKALLLACLVLVGLSTPAWAATTYYVATTGNDTTGDGTEETPWATPNKCFSTGTPLVAGDTCTVADGTYTDTDGNGTTVTILAASGAPAGSAGNPITLKSTNLAGATIVVNENASATIRVGLRLNRPYYIIEGFIWTGEGASITVPSTADVDGLRLEGGSDYAIIRRNTLHDIARTVCSNSAFGFNGIGIQGTSQLIEYNLFYALGRLRGNIGESGCVLSPGGSGLAHHDHGIYATTTTDLTIRHNVIYDTNRGWPLQFYGGTTTRATVYHNTFHGKSPETVGTPYTQVLIGSAWSGASLIKNNLFSDPKEAPLNGSTPTGSGTIALSYNLTDSTDADWFRGAMPSQVVSGDCTPGCVDSTSPGFVAVGSNNFTLAAGSAAINAGLNVGLGYNGSAPDIGAFETFTYASATVNENFLDVTLGMDANTPILPATGLTGFTALVGGVPRTTVSAQRLAGTDSVVRITFDGAACAGGQTWTVTYASGNATDSALIGGHLNQPLSAFTAQAVTNTCGSAPPSPPGTPLITYLLDDNTGTVVDNTGSSGATDDGALTGTVAWSAGKNLYGVTMTDLVDGTVAIPYGSGVNLSTQSVTVAFWVNVPTDLIDNGRMYFGTSPGTNQRFYLVTSAGTWRLGIQSSTYSPGASNLAVAAGWNRVCLVADSGTDIATLSVNGVTGTGSAAKAYTSYALASDLSLGQPFNSIGNPGVTYDDFNLWTSAESCADDWAAAEPPPAPSTMVLTQKRHQFYQSHYAAGTTTKVLIGAQQAAITKFAGESFALETQTDATVAGGSVAQRLFYSRNSGAFQPVTDDCTTTDQVCFVGIGTDPTDLINESPAACLSGALTPITGSTEITAAAVPVTTFTTNSCTEHIRVLKFGATAVETDTYDFLEYEQTGVAFAGTPEPAGGARVTVEGATPGITAPTNLHFSGPTNSSVATLIWSPVTYVGLAAYDIFRSTTTGVYGTEPTYSVTVAGARASHSPMTQLIMRLPTADEYFFVVKARDTDGTRSAASSEASITMTGQVARTLR